MRSQRSIAPRRARPVLGNPTYVAPRYHSSIWGRTIFLVLIMVLIGAAGGAGFFVWALHHPESSSSRRVAVDVGTGDTVTSIADRLHAEGLIDNPLYFRIDARLHNLSSELKAGIYHIRRNMSVDDMVLAFTKYTSPTVAITVPEGYRARQIASVLQARGISGRAFLDEVDRPTIQDPILADKPRGTTLEGYLFPSTYKVPPNISGRAFADFMVRTLAQKFTPAMREEARRHGFTAYQVLTLASIVERETPSPEERALVAGVYANRLHDRMFLDADPTIQYAIGSQHAWHPGLPASSSFWWPILQQTTFPSPYNTYNHYGLPPGPIANPGLASIQAAISPRKTQFLYFVARGNGHHVFAVTYAQQLANQARYQH